MSQGSMSVSSLIDKFSDPENVSKEQPRQQQRRPEESDKGNNEREFRNSGLLSLLGPNVTSFPYSESAYIETVKLRTEQERTKQDYYRLEIANKNLAIIQTAIQAQIPPTLIPSMCVGNGPDQRSEQSQDKGISDVRSIREDIKNRSGSLLHPDSLNASTIPPISYKFGEGSTSRRSSSPAKIGAQAVANLAAPTTPYRSSLLRRSNRIVPSHQRHYSMPVETSKTSSLDSTINLNPPRRSRPPAAYPNSAKNGPATYQDVSPLRSPLGSTATLQVKPTPAQSLNKQNKLNQTPSQESMTSFQHVIQFHHWKPEQGPGESFSSQGSPHRSQHSHKRHKSTSENMSIDMTPSLPEGNIPEIRFNNQNISRSVSVDESKDDSEHNEENDITMDTSTITESNPRKHSRRGSLVSEGFNDHTSSPKLGRYPHDILSPSN